MDNAILKHLFLTALQLWLEYAAETSYTLAMLRLIIGGRLPFFRKQSRPE
jgi:hypothetical protein